VESDTSRSTFEGPRRPRALGRSPAAIVAALLPVPWVVWYAFWTFEWEPGVLGVKLMAMTPWVAYASVIPVLVALALRQWLSVMTSVLLLFLFGTAVIAPRLFWGPRTVAKDGVELRVMSSNLYVGHADARTVVDMVRDDRVDVLSLVEMPPEELARLDRAGLRTLLPYRDTDARPGANGSGLFSRYPLTKLKPYNVLDVNGPPRAAVAVPGAVAVDVQVLHPPPPLNGDWLRRWRRAIGEIPAQPDRHDGRAHMVIGDFNATLDHPELRRLTEGGYDDAASEVHKGLVMTWPANRRYPPIIAIDHVLVDDRIGAASFDARKVKGSDHRAVVATVRIPRRL
jgi:endonuclease/exonuclease/phosphatase (EEP) superfamily protein YafD